MIDYDYTELSALNKRVNEAGDTIARIIKEGAR